MLQVTPSFKKKKSQEKDILIENKKSQGDVISFRAWSTIPMVLPPSHPTPSLSMAGHTPHLCSMVLSFHPPQTDEETAKDAHLSVSSKNDFYF